MLVLMVSFGRLNAEPPSHAAIYRIMVKYKPGVTNAQIEAIEAQQQLKRIEFLKMTGIYIYGTNDLTVVSKLMVNPLVKYAEKDSVVKIDK